MKAYHFELPQGKHEAKMNTMYTPCHDDMDHQNTADAQNRQKQHDLGNLRGVQMSR